MLSLTKILKKANSFDNIGNVKLPAHRAWFSGTTFNKPFFIDMSISFSVIKSKHYGRVLTRETIYKFLKTNNKEYPKISTVGKTVPIKK